MSQETQTDNPSGQAIFGEYLPVAVGSTLLRGAILGSAATLVGPFVLLLLLWVGSLAGILSSILDIDSFWLLYHIYYHIQHPPFVVNSIGGAIDSAGLGILFTLIVAVPVGMYTCSGVVLARSMESRGEDVHVLHILTVPVGATATTILFLAGSFLFFEPALGNFRPQFRTFTARAVRYVLFAGILYPTAFSLLGAGLTTSVSRGISYERPTIGAVLRPTRGNRELDSISDFPLLRGTVVGSATILLAPVLIVSLTVLIEDISVAQVISENPVDILHAYYQAQHPLFVVETVGLSLLEVLITGLPFVLLTCAGFALGWTGRFGGPEANIRAGLTIVLGTLPTTLLFLAVSFVYLDPPAWVSPPPFDTFRGRALRYVLFGGILYPVIFAPAGAVLADKIGRRLGDDKLGVTSGEDAGGIVEETRPRLAEAVETLERVSEPTVAGNLVCYRGRLESEPVCIYTVSPDATENVHEEFTATVDDWLRVHRDPAAASIVGQGIEPEPWVAVESPADAHRLGDADLSAEGLLSVLAPAAEAAGKLELTGVAHGDISPECIWVRGDSEEPTGVLGGLGLKRAVREASGEEHVTPYTAPEQLSEEYGAVNGSADIYALGAVAYEQLTGDPPVPAEKDAILAGEITPLSEVADVPDAVETAVMRALETDPAERFDSAYDLGSALNRAL